MTFYRLVGIALLLSAWSVPARAANSGQTITAAQIAAAISSTGLIVAAGQVSLLSDVVAKTCAPSLRVQSFGPWESDRSQVRLKCTNSEECLPFIVAIRRDQGNSSKGVILPRYPQVWKGAKVETSTDRVVVRNGSSAILLLDGGHVHIQLLVVCNENGSVGQTIRVTGKGREQTYMAVVGSDGFLRGRL